MKNINDQYKKGNISKTTGNFWICLLQWLRLLVLSLTRARDHLSGIIFHWPESPPTDKMILETITQHKIIKNKKLSIMKQANRHIKWVLMLVLTVCAMNASAQYPNSGPHSVCLNSTEPYGVTLTAGSTYAWSITPLAGGNGTIVSGQGTNLISINWTSTGTARLEVIETITATGCSGDTVSIIVTVNALPVITLTGPTPVCLNSTGNVYTTQAGMTNYIWTVVGGTITAGGTATDNTATVTWTTSGIQSISVNYTNGTSCTAAAPFVLNVTVNPLPVITLTGPTPVCLNSTGNVYTTQAGMTNYIWTVVGGTITAGGTVTDNTATVTWTSVGVQSISVNYTNGCTAAAPTVFNVTVNPVPVITLTGPTPVCLNSTGNVYTTQAGMTNYIWTVVGGTITAGGTVTDNTATVTWTTSGVQSISVNYSNANGCTAAAAQVFNVTVNPLPVITLTGPTPVCLNSTGNVYTTQAGMTNYIWTVVGGTITAGGTATDNTATVTWTSSGVQSISVNYTNGTSCTAAAPFVLNVTVNPIPTPVITGPAPVCESITGTTVTYSTPLVAGNTYTWVVTGGTFVVGATPNIILVTWTTPGAGSVQVTESIPSSSCTAVANLAVTVNPKPVTTPITHN
jgi:PKD-like domain